MHRTTLFERALAASIAAVLSAGLLASVLGAGRAEVVEVSAARATIAGAEIERAEARATSVDADAVALGGELATPPTTTAPTTTTPPTTAPPAPAPAPAPSAPAPAAGPTTAAPAPAPTAPPTTAAPAAAPSTSFARVTSCETNMMGWMNEARSSQGVPALTADAGIQWIPLQWSDGMASRQELAHNPRFGEQIFAERPHAMSASENVGRSTTGDRSIFDGFMQSPSHRAEVLASGNTHAAVGCLRDGGGQLWVTVNFWG